MIIEYAPYVENQLPNFKEMLNLDNEKAFDTFRRFLELENVLDKKKLSK